MHPVSEVILPAGNILFQFPDFSHECFIFDVLLEVKAIVGDEFQSFFDEGKDRDLFIRAQFAVLVLIEDTQELFYGADLDEVVELRLELSEDCLKHLLG